MWTDSRISFSKLLSLPLTPVHAPPSTGIRCPLSAGSGGTGGEVQPSELNICCLSHVCLAIGNRLHMQYPDSAQAVISCSTDES